MFVGAHQAHQNVQNTTSIWPTKDSFCMPSGGHIRKSLIYLIIRINCFINLNNFSRVKITSSSHLLIDLTIFYAFVIFKYPKTKRVKNNLRGIVCAHI